jgi:hypothetical protein
MSFVLDFKASLPSGPLGFAMLSDLSRSLEPLPDLLRGRGWCHLLRNSGVSMSLGVFRRSGDRLDRPKYIYV